METSRSDARIHLRAYYLWEADGRPEGRADEYWTKAQALLKEESRVTAPVDEANAAGALLTQEKRPTGATQQFKELPTDAVRAPSSKVPSARKRKLKGEQAGGRSRAKSVEPLSAAHSRQGQIRLRSP
jgi:hypothetical protein